MINELQTGDFVFYEQKIREAKDDYTKNKILKDRRKAHKWINIFLEDREIILTYKNGEQIVTTIATLKNNSHNPLPLPSTPLTHVEKDGETVLEDQYIRFYRVPQMIPDSVHVDQILCFFAKNDGLNELSAKLTNVGRRYVKESVQEQN